MNNIKDLLSLSSKEFENLCYLLMKKMGFSVKTTSISGDGGIDLIANYNKPMFRGKYIVQCKRYSGSVGVPIIRDLYGVVMDERANKGILITTGNFTQSAIEFATNKNLELIDGIELCKILSEYDLWDKTKLLASSTFLTNPLFDVKKYNFYRSMIDQNMLTIEMGKEFLFSFLFGYLTHNNKNPNFLNLYMLNNGLAQEYIELFDWYIDTYYKKGKEQQEVAPYYRLKYRGLALLYNFDLFEYVQSRYEILLSKNLIKLSTCVDGHGGKRPRFTTYDLSKIPEEYKQDIYDNRYNYDKVKYSVNNKVYELLNLYSIFKHLEIDIGVKLINKILYGDAPEFKEWIENLDTYQLLSDKFVINLPDIKIRHIKTKSGKSQFDRVILNYEYVGDEYIEPIDLSTYFKYYRDLNIEKFVQEKNKIIDLLNTL